MAFYARVTTGSLVYLIYVFATAPTFGDHAECNDRTVYVLFGVDISATSPVLRWMLVGALSILLLILICWLLMVTCICIDALFGREMRGVFAGRGGHEGSNAKRQSPYQLVSYLVGTIYLAVMLELMIRRNALAPGLDEWTFGQILAMAMLIGPLIELASLLLGKVDGRQDNNQLVPVSMLPVSRRRTVGD